MNKLYSRDPEQWNSYILGKIELDENSTKYDHEIGKTYGFMKIEKYIGRGDYNRPFFMCECLRCHSHKIVDLYVLHRGLVISCGCLQKESTSIANTTHGESKTRLYRKYYGMLTRCYNKNDAAYQHYGARNIKICDEWLGQDGYLAFKAWALASGYKDGLTIERKNPNSDYCPENCTWITMKDQAENKTSTNWIRYNSYEFPESIWEKITGINRDTIHYRYFKLGWSAEKTLRTPGGYSKKTKKYLVWDVPPEYLKYQKSF